MPYARQSILLVKYLMLVSFLQPFYCNSLHDKSNLVNNYHKRLLVLIIASDDLPVYIELQKIWQSYMHKYPHNIKAYFIKGDPSIPNNYQIKNDIIWLKTAESLKPGILNKTLMAMESFLPMLDQFDYVLRTNLSSFYVFPRLLNFLEKCPKTGFYAGVCYKDEFISGSGFLLSPDLVNLLVTNKKTLFNNKKYDDVAIGHFMRKHGVKFSSHKRMDFLDLQDWKKNKKSIPNDTFQFRIKTPSYLRTDDIYIHLQLRKMFYSI
jgi:hypothetical protein